MAKVLVDQAFLEDGLELICDKIRLKTGGTGVLAFPVEIASAVESIEGSGGITPTGTKSITENGTYDVTAFASASVAVPTGTDTSDATAGAADIAADKTAYIATGKTTGGAAVRSASDLTASGKTVTVPAGIYREQATKDVAAATQATPSLSVNASTGVVTATASQSAGYVAAGTKSGTLQLTTKSAQTYTPGTTQQEIPAGRYLTGKQTIAGDPNLVPQNIKNGVTIFSKTGTYKGDPAALDNNMYAADYFGTVSGSSVSLNFPANVGNVIGVLLTHKTEMMGWVGNPIMTYLALPGADGTMTVAITAADKKSTVIKNDSWATITSSGCTLYALDASAQGLEDLNFDTTSGAYTFTLITA